MKTIKLIIQREYITRVKKKSFLIMSIVGPLLMAALMIAPAWLANLDSDKVYHIAVIDQTKVFDDTIIDTSYLTNIRLKHQNPDPKKMYVRRLPDSKNYKFTFIDTSHVDKHLAEFDTLGYDVLLFIPKNILASSAIEMYSKKEITLATKLYITKKIEKDIQKQKLKAYGIDKPIETNIKVFANVIDDEGKINKSSSELTSVIAIFGGLLIYMFIFMYGAQVMRGVIEEKTNRIIEVIISSVKPFQLMMGKVIGVAMVGLTQFLIWVVLTFAIVIGVKQAMMPSTSDLLTQQIQTKDIMDNNINSNLDLSSKQDDKSDIVSDAFEVVKSVNWGTMSLMFIFYFLGGYLLYAAMFAAIGSAVDSEADTQQFMLPITVPLILSMVMIQNVIQNPDGTLAFWFSIIPFTSPVIMMARIPFSVPVWQVALSAALLIITFILITKFAAKIYRIGILMYGKKPTYKELLKWLRY